MQFKWADFKTFASVHLIDGKYLTTLGLMIIRKEIDFIEQEFERDDLTEHYADMLEFRLHHWKKVLDKSLLYSKFREKGLKVIK